MMISYMRMINMQIAVKKDDEIVLLDTDQILYIEAVERSTFVYTRDDYLEIDIRLYEADINRKIRVTLINGEQIIVSRMYAEGLRKRLGVKRKEQFV